MALQKDPALQPSSQQLDDLQVPSALIDSIKTEIESEKNPRVVYQGLSEEKRTQFLESVKSADTKALIIIQKIAQAVIDDVIKSTRFDKEEKHSYRDVLAGYIVAAAYKKEQTPEDATLLKDCLGAIAESTKHRILDRSFQDAIEYTIKKSADPYACKYAIKILTDPTVIRNDAKVTPELVHDASSQFANCLTEQGSEVSKSTLNRVLNQGEMRPEVLLAVLTDFSGVFGNRNKFDSDTVKAVTGKAVALAEKIPSEDLAKMIDQGFILTNKSTPDEVLAVIVKRGITQSASFLTRSSDNEPNLRTSVLKYLEGVDESRLAKTLQTLKDQGVVITQSQIFSISSRAEDEQYPKALKAIDEFKKALPLI
jgi:hypothetical protein